MVLGLLLLEDFLIRGLGEGNNLDWVLDTSYVVSIALMVSCFIVLLRPFRSAFEKRLRFGVKSVKIGPIGWRVFKILIDVCLFDQK